MATPPFKYQPMFEKGKDTTEYYLLTKDYVSVSEFEGNPILKIEKEGLTAMANAAFRDVSFMLRRSHNEQVAKILSDPEASENDKYVALTFLRNAEVASKGVLPFCQDTGTAIIHGEKGQQVWTGYSDEEALSLGVYKTYTEENLRYSQNAPLNMYDEVNTKCNLPAQIDIEATEGMEYEFLCVTKGGGSANKTYLYQETKAILNPGTLVPFLVEKMKTLGTAACPPYHIAFVIGGTSAEKNLLTVKLASTHFYDNLPTTGNEYGRAFRDVVGLAGLVGAGRTEVLRAVFGADSYDSGSVTVDGVQLPKASIDKTIAAGVGLVPEDRRTQGLILEASVADNLGLATMVPTSKFGFADLKGQRDRENDTARKLRIRMANIDQTAGSLSGGNQQKIVFGKWSMANVKVLLLDEPTRGVDVGARVEIYELINEITANGGAVLMASSDLPEVLGMSDRVLVMSNGKLSGEMPASEATQERVMSLAVSHMNEDFSENTTANVEK